MGVVVVVVASAALAAARERVSRSWKPVWDWTGQVARVVDNPISTIIIHCWLLMLLSSFFVVVVVAFVKVHHFILSFILFLSLVTVLFPIDKRRERDRSNADSIL
jgi:hypothetical protein